MTKLGKEFYLRDDVLQISRELLGKYLYTSVDGIITGGMIVETEAYMAPEDKASHAFGNRRTTRTEIFFSEGGVSYVYLCYGIHYLFNIVTNQKDIPHAILIRAIEPVEGIETMMTRRKKGKPDFKLTSGPGALTQALGIQKLHNGMELTGDLVWVEDKKIYIKRSDIVSGPRVGIDYAGEFVSKPWRFWIKGNPWVSKT